MLSTYHQQKKKTSNKLTLYKKIFSNVSSILLQAKGSSIATPKHSCRDYASLRYVFFKPNSQLI